MRLMVLAGEASGDAYAAELIPKIVAKATMSLQVEAMGGRRSREAGAKIVEDSSTWSAMGFVRALVVAPKVLIGYYRLVRHVRRGEPGLLVPIDFGSVNVRVARHARACGWKVLYFVPPGSWRRDRQGASMPEVADAVVTPFPWSAEILRRMGCNALFFGHPLKQMVKMSLPAVPADRAGIAVLPGSRNHEIHNNMPAIAGALAKFPDEIAEFAVAPSADSGALKLQWLRLAPSRTQDKFTVGDRYGVLARAKAGVVCSGTATLEAVLCGCPMVVVYRVGKVMELEVRLLKLLPKYAALPNIALDRRAVPEFIQHEATPDNIVAALSPLLQDSPERRAQLEAFDETAAMLGPDDAIDRTVELAAEMLTNMAAAQSRA